MLTPTYGPSEYLDATTFNTMAGYVTASIQGVGYAALSPGFILPENVTITNVGLRATVVLPQGVLVIFNSGTFGQPDGTTPGAFNRTYTVDFAPLVPTVGTVVAFLTCSATTVGQVPVTVVGPPPGHPDWNPQFQPYTLYSITQDSITITASTAVPDNQTTFALGQVTLTAGMSVLPTINSNLIYRAGALSAKPVQQRSGNWSMATTSQGIIQNAPAPSTFTLPSVYGLNGMVFEFSSATTGAVTVQSQGGDQIWGTGTAAVTSLSMAQGSSAKFVAQNGAWYIMSASPNMSSGGGGGTVGPTNYVYDVNNQPTTYVDMGINDTYYLSFSNVRRVPTHVNTLGGVFRVVICISHVSDANNDLLWLPNNTTYPGNANLTGDGSFSTWSTENSDAPDPWDTNFTQQQFPYLSRVPHCSASATLGDFTTPLGYFAMDAFGDGNRNNAGDTINDIGPCMYDILLGTSTGCKMVKFNGGVAGGCGTGVVRWYDTTTPWQLLGTFGIAAFLDINQLSLISGFCYIQKIGGAISVG